MIDGPEPFGKETAKAAQELAKTASNALDAARDTASFFYRVLGNPIDNAVGITIADPLWFVRITFLDWYNRRVNEIFAKRSARKLKGAPPRIALDFVVAGGFISYGPGASYTEQHFSQAADYVIRILNGEKPAGLPVQAPTKLVLVINTGAAKALGLEIPARLSALADELIE